MNPTEGVRPLISVSDLLNQSWALFASRYKTFLRFTLAQLGLYAAGVAVFVVGFLPVVLTRNPAYFAALIVALPLGVALLYPLFRITLSMMLFTASNEGGTFTHFWSLSRGRIGGLLYIAVINACAIFGGSLLFIIPGIALAFSLALTGWVYVCEDKRGFDAVAQSIRYIHGRWWGVFGRVALLSLIMGMVSGALGMLFASSQVASLIVRILFSLASVGFSASYAYLLYKSMRETAAPAYRANLTVVKAFLSLAALFALGIIAFLVFLASLRF